MAMPIERYLTAQATLAPTTDDYSAYEREVAFPGGSINQYGED